ncbi:hypothetical protein NQZ79_g482 [Umbelopsis isabellina]|nr:hypothetical protein NQZ79_g482 [Umbelopsis isabellina]
MSSASQRLESLKNQVLYSGPATGKEDIARERANTSFDIESMKRFWAGGQESYDAMQKAYGMIKDDPELIVQAPRNFHELSREEHREFTMGQIFKSVQLFQDIKDPKLLEALRMALIQYSESFSMRFYVHEFLFKGALNMFGTEEQKEEWLPKIAKCQVFGCFAMTELGHSSFLRGLETRATFDVERDEFVIESPSVTATKWWIGMAAHTATHTVALCQTYIHGKNHGINWFIVPLHDRVDGELVPGVITGDIGAKYGRSGLDNGWIQFKGVRVPRGNLLGKWVSVTRDGTFNPAPNPAVMYGTLIPERLSVTTGCQIMMGQALLIAARYGVVRRQGAKNQQIMDYQSHCVNLMPGIAFQYVLRLTERVLQEQFQNLTSNGKMDPKTYLENVGDMHAVSASFKAASTWFGSEVLENCRRACGGHAYSAYNSIGAIIQDWGVVTTGAGDNVVLLQQTGKYLLYGFKEVVEGRSARGSIEYLNKYQEWLAQDSCKVDDERDWLQPSLAADVLTWIIVKQLEVIATTIASSATNYQEAFNDNMLHIVRVAEVQCFTHLLRTFITAIDDLEKEQSNAVKKTDLADIPTLRKLATLWGLHVLFKYMDFATMEGYLTATQARSIQHQYYKTCMDLRKDVIGLTDAWGIPDFIHKAPIGRYDGDIYPDYLKTLVNAPGCFGPPPYHSKYIKPLTDPSLNK